MPKKDQIREGVRARELAKMRRSNARAAAAEVQTEKAQRARNKQLNPVTRGEELRRREFVRAAQFAEQTKGTGRSAQTRAAADRAQRALRRAQGVTRARRRRGQPVRPPLEPRR